MEGQYYSKGIKKSKRTKENVKMTKDNKEVKGQEETKNNWIDNIEFSQDDLREAKETIESTPKVDIDAIMDPERARIPSIEDLQQFPPFAPGLDSLKKEMIVQAPLATSKDFTPAKCPLCDNGLDQHEVDGTYIYTCSECPSINIEFYGDKDYYNLGKHLGIVAEPAFKGIVEEATAFDVFNAIKALEKKELHFESAVKQLLNNSLGDWKQQAEDSNDEAVQLVYREYKNVKGQSEQLLRTKVQIDTPVGRDAGWVKRLS
jgi:hypothetical protein